MESFMPSEIARLVLGYLKEIPCSNTTNLFLVECPYLKEYSECLQNGYEYPTNVGGKNLRKILHEYYCLRLASDKRRISQTPPKMPVKSSTVISTDLNPRLNCIDTEFEMREKTKIDASVQTDKIHSPFTIHQRNASCSPIRFSDHLSVNSEKYSSENNSRNSSVGEQHNRSRSPRRKIQTPKKHVTIDTNSSTSKKSNVPSCLSTATEDNNSMDRTEEESLDVTGLVEQLINSKDLHEKIAENINKAVTTSQNRSEDENKVTSATADMDSIGLESIIKDVVDKTESDPVFEDLLSSFFDNMKYVDESGCELTESPEAGIIQPTLDYPNQENQNQPSQSSFESDNAGASTSAGELNERVQSDAKNQAKKTVPSSSAVSLLPKSQILLLSTDNGRTVPVSRVDATKQGPQQLSTLPNVCFPSSTNLVLKTPHKSGQVVSVITVSPGETEWPALPDVNFVMSSPYHDLLKQVENASSDTRKVRTDPCYKQARRQTRTMKAKPVKHKLPDMPTMNQAGRIDCHVIRNLNFTSASSTTVTSISRGNKSPGKSMKTTKDVNRMKFTTEQTKDKESNHQDPARSPVCGLEL